MAINTEQCPLCGTELSAIKFREIQSKLHDEERRKAAEIAQIEARTRQQLEQQFKLSLERQLRAAEKKANMETEQQLKKMVAERDQAAKKLKEAEAREAFIRKQMQEEAELQRQKELSQQRQVLERDRDAALIRQQAEFNRQRESFQKKMKSMEQQLLKKTANELGDGAEIDLFEALREAFPTDRISRVPKGQAGADILHEVFHKGKSCGKIIIDSKNRQSWQNVFITKLRQDQVEARAEHAILATTVFPAGKKEMCIESNVIVIAPARVSYMVEVLRQAMIAMYTMGLSMKERSSKMTLLYKLITSESYSRKFSEAGSLAQEILELDVQEKKAHDSVWKKRGTLATRIRNVLREVETDVAAVIEGVDDGEIPAFPAKSAWHDGTDSREAVAWMKH